VNALADDAVADFINEHCTATYLKVGTFKIVGGAKVGGNVASYFCLPDGSLVHAIAGKVRADEFVSEARWGLETRKAALTFATHLPTGRLDVVKFRNIIQRAHHERFLHESGWKVPPELTGKGPLPLPPLPYSMPLAGSREAKVHWLLASRPLAHVEKTYPVVWQRILNEKVSGLPVATR
jgi:hypothetical protein